MASKRLDKIKNARSLNDVLDVIKEIAYEFKNSSAIVTNLVSSLSAEISFDHRDTKKSKVIKDTKFVAPKLSELQKHIEVIHKLYDNVVELDAAEAMVKQSFTGNKKLPAALAAISELKKDIDNNINDAFDALQEIANKHLPSSMEDFIDKITGHIIDTLSSKSYKNIFRQVYVTPDPTNKGFLHFASYIGIEDLKTVKGFAFDQYFIVVTGVINKQGDLSYYINSLPDFKVPGKYPLGRNVNSEQEAKKQINMLFAHNNFVVENNRLPMPITDDRSSTLGLTNLANVEKASVKEDELTVVLSPKVKTDAAVQKVLLDILARLNSAVGARKNNKVFSYKIGAIGGKKAIKFILVPNGEKSTHLNLSKLDEVSDLLSLTDKQKEALRFALQH